MVKNRKSISKRNGFWWNIFCKWLIEIKALHFFLVDKIKIFYRKGFKLNFVHHPQLMIGIAICQIPQVIVTVGWFESRQKFCYLASIILNSCPSLLLGWICFCLLFSLFRALKSYYSRCFSVTCIFSNSSQNSCLKAFWKATVIETPILCLNISMRNFQYFCILSKIKSYCVLLFYTVPCLASLFSTV